jgi:hypothetical protein
MDTSNLFVKKIVVLLLFTFAICIALSAQQPAGVKNYAAVYTGIGWTTSTINAGIYCERILLAGSSTELGVKAQYTGRYKEGNLILLFGNANGQQLSEAGLSATGYLYPKHNIDKGFFVGGEAGALLLNLFSKDRTTQRLSPFLSTGFGWKLPVNRQLAVRLQCSLLCPVIQRYPGAGTRSVLGLSLGF